jgi:hypothetical protein
MGSAAAGESARVRGVLVLPGHARRRNCAGVGRSLGKSTTLVERWSSRWRWQDRIRSYDRHVDTLAWPVKTFETVTGVIDGRAVRNDVAERSRTVLPGFRMREVRRRCANGHQTAILTTRTDLPIEVVAYRMVERWTQENFFRYRRQHFALDALVTYAAEPADPERPVPNPARKTVATARAALTELEHAYGQQARANREVQRPTMRGFKIAQAGLTQQMATLEATIGKLKARLAKLPQRVAVKAVFDEAETVTLAPEAKHLTDTIKMVAFRAETALVHALTANDARTGDEGHSLIREMLLTSADILPQPADHRLVVHLHALANPRSNAALARLCDTLNALQVRYPGTDLTLVYQAPGVA